MNSRIYALLFALFLFGCDGPATEPGSPRGDRVAADTSWRVANSGDYRPFSHWPEGAAAPTGFSADVASAFARSAGIEIEWVRFRWPSLQQDLVEDRFDVALSGITVRPDRSIAGIFSIPLTTSGALVLVPEATDLMTPADLDQPGIRLAVNAGGHLERVARRLFPRARIEPVDRNQDVLDRLVGGSPNGGVDGVVTDTIEAPHWQARFDGSLRRIGPLTRDRKAALFPADRAEAANRFDVWLLEAEATGQLARLRQQHALPTTRTAEPMAALLTSLDERLALMQSVANAKATLALPVENLEVERRVLEAAWTGVEAAARSHGRPVPDRTAVDALFRAQIEAAKWIQREELAARNAPEALDVDRTQQTTSSPPSEASREQARHELDQALRPALLRIGDRIAWLITILPGSDESPPPYAETRDALERHGLPEARLRAIQDALVNLLRAASPNASTPPPPAAATGTAPSE